MRLGSVVFNGRTFTWLMTLAAVADADAVNIANVTGIDVNTDNACLNGLAKAPDGTTPPGGTTPSGDTPPRNVSADVLVETIPKQKVLADTGGINIVAIAASGILLFSGGISLMSVTLRRRP